MLEGQIRNTFQKHIHEGGLITAPEKLLGAVLQDIAGWLKSHEQQYREAGSLAEAEALRDLRVNLLKGG